MGGELKNWWLTITIDSREYWGGKEPAIVTIPTGWGRQGHSCPLRSMWIRHMFPKMVDHPIQGELSIKLLAGPQNQPNMLMSPMGNDNFRLATNIRIEDGSGKTHRNSAMKD